MNPRHATLASWLFFALLCLACARSVEAKSMVSPTGAAGVTFGPGRVQFHDGSSIGGKFTGRTTTALPSGGANVVEKYVMPVGGAIVEVGAARLLTPAGIGIALAGVALTTGYDALNIKLGNEPTGLGIQPLACVLAGKGWQCRETADPTGTPGPCTMGYSFSLRPFGWSTPQCTAEAACTKASGESSALGFNGYTKFVAPGTCQYWSTNGSPTEYFVSTAGANHQPNTGQSAALCPAAVDEINFYWNVPANSEPDQNGKCRTGRYNVGNGITTADELAAAAEHYIGNNPAKGKALIDELLAQGVPIYSPDGRAISGPSHAIGTETNVVRITDENGVPVTTRVKTIPRVDYDYPGGGLMGFRTSSTTTTTVEKNGVTTTVSVETKEDGASSNVVRPGEESEKPEVNPCKGNEDTVGCTKLGEPTTEKPTWQERPVTPYTPDALNLPSGCPAPITLPMFGGRTGQWSYEPICNTAPIVRPLFLAMVGLGCMALVIRQTTAT